MTVRIHVWNPPELAFIYLMDGIAYMPCLEEDTEELTTTWKEHGHQAAFDLADKKYEPLIHPFRTDFPTTVWLERELLVVADREFGTNHLANRFNRDQPDDNMEPDP